MKMPNRVFIIFITLFLSLLTVAQAAQAASACTTREHFSTALYTFDDIIGCDTAKTAFRDILVYLKNPDSTIRPPQSYLLTGRPDTGKSLLANALGGEIKKTFAATGRGPEYGPDVRFYSFSTDFIHGKGTDWLIKLAQKESPCVIFLDELFCCGCSWGWENTNDIKVFLNFVHSPLNQQKGKEVFVIAATTDCPYHAEKITACAQLFTTVIHFELPTYTERRSFLANKLAITGMTIDPLTLDTFAKLTEDKSYRDLTAAINHLYYQSRISHEPITLELLEKSLLNH